MNRLRVFLALVVLGSLAASGPSAGAPKTDADESSGSGRRSGGSGRPRAAPNYSSPGTLYVQTTITPRYLLPAVREPGDDPHAPVVPRDDYAPQRLNAATDGEPIKR